MKEKILQIMLLNAENQNLMLKMLLKNEENKNKILKTNENEKNNNDNNDDDIKNELKKLGESLGF